MNWKKLLLLSFAVLGYALTKTAVVYSPGESEEGSTVRPMPARRRPRKISPRRRS